MEGKGFTIDRRKIQLNEPLKTVGNHQVSIKLHKEVSVPVKVKILKEGGSEEAAAPAAPAATEEASAEA